MSVIDLETFIRENPPKGFKPGAFYNKDGDQIEAFFDGEASYADPAHEQSGIVLFRAVSDHRIVGFEILGVRRLIKE